MLRELRFILVAAPLALAACAQQEEPMPPRVIKGEPIYNKYGSVVGCEQGLYIPGAQLPYQCMPPPPPGEQCDPTYASNDPNCLPPYGRQPDPKTGRTPNQRGPMGTP
ncbi:MAG: hypothetical protein CMH12_20555 [Maritimibacter sp.]|nr:hypothetical protein [Maritimibacter sp.]